MDQAPSSVTEPVDPPGVNPTSRLVSVVLPVRNADRYVSAALWSVLDQTHTDLEVVVIDNGSTDRTRQVVGSIAAGDGRVRLIEEGDIGLVAALNLGMAEASGPFVARMDADDISEPTRFERQIRYLDEHPNCVVVGTGYLLIDADDKVVGRRRVPTSHELIRAETCFGSPIGHPTVMFAPNRVSSGVWYSGDYPDAEDYELWLRLLNAGSVANIDEPLVRYRVHDASVTSTDTDRHRRSAIAAHDHHSSWDDGASLLQLTYNPTEDVGVVQRLRGIVGLNARNLREPQFQRRALAVRSGLAVVRVLRRATAQLGGRAAGMGR